MFQNNPSSPSGLSAILARENAAWRTLLTLLENEERALADGDADRLAPLNASKLSQLDTLGDLARARHAALLDTGCTPDHAGMADWLAQKGQPEDQLCWQQLLEMEPQAQALNARIGVLIDLRLSSTRQALNVLIQSATQHGGLYDQAGQAVNAGHRKPLAAV